ncbi:MAG: hypothetical protein WDO06_03930 [Actinomycetota bacterium]
MPINPQAQAFLDLVSSFNLPDISEQGAYTARAGSHDAPDLSGTIDPTVRIDHLYFASPTADLPLRIYTPSAPGPYRAHRLLSWRGMGHQYCQTL